mgnify:CR=1 FL=1
MHILIAYSCDTSLTGRDDTGASEPFNAVGPQVASARTNAGSDCRRLERTTIAHGTIKNGINKGSEPAARRGTV